MDDIEFRAAAKLNAHDKVRSFPGGPRSLSMGEMINIGVDEGIDFERLRVCSVLRRRADNPLELVVTRDLLHTLSHEIEEGIQ